MPAKTSAYKVYQVKLTVKDIRPPIWRRVLLRSDASLAQLHPIIQSLMSWFDLHLWAYLISGEEYGPPMEDDDLNGRRKPVETRLSSIFGKGTKTITYEYDFGDGWEVRIQLEGVLAGMVQQQPAVCTAGARHGPAEDSGGPYGYQEKLEILKDPQHPEHTETKEWIGDYFDSEDFDLKETNEELSRLK